jgi:hypothetical protein
MHPEESIAVILYHYAFLFHFRIYLTLFYIHLSTIFQLYRGGQSFEGGNRRPRRKQPTYLKH